MSPGRKQELSPPITQEEVYLAVRDKARGKATGPDKMPTEVYRHLTGLHEVMASIFALMAEENYIPPELCQYFIIPLDKMGKGPSSCEGKRPISLLNTFITVLETILVRRMKTV